MFFKCHIKNIENLFFMQPLEVQEVKCELSSHTHKIETIECFVFYVFEAPFKIDFPFLAHKIYSVTSVLLFVF